MEDNSNNFIQKNTTSPYQPGLFKNNKKNKFYKKNREKG